MAKEVATTNQNALEMNGASPELLARVAEIKENMDAIENFQLPKVKMTAGGMELFEGEEPVSEIEGVVIHARKQNIYYEKQYNPSDVSPPDCFSLDGVVPSASVAHPQNKTCKGCPKAEFGTNSMKSGKACRNLKPLYILISDDAVLPRMLAVPPSSLKSADQYLLNLTERGVNYRKVKTKINAFKENSKDTYCRLKFTMGEKLSEQRVKDVEAIRSTLMPLMQLQALDRQISEGEVPVAKANDNTEY